MPAPENPVSRRIPPEDLMIQFIPGADSDDTTSEALKGGIDCVITRLSPLYDKASESTQYFDHIGVFHSKYDENQEAKYNLLVFKSTAHRGGVHCKFFLQTGWTTLEQAIQDYTWMWDIGQPAPTITRDFAQISFPDPLEGESVETQDEQGDDTVEHSAYSSARDRSQI